MKKHYIVSLLSIIFYINLNASSYQLTVPGIKFHRTASVFSFISFKVCTESFKNYTPDPSLQEISNSFAQSHDKYLKLLQRSFKSELQQKLEKITEKITENTNEIKLTLRPPYLSRDIAEKSERVARLDRENQYLIQYARKVLHNLNNPTPINDFSAALTLYIDSERKVPAYPYTLRLQQDLRKEREPYLNMLHNALKSWWLTTSNFEN